MTQKIVNYHALATTIKSEVEKLSGKQTSLNTIVVAIKRFSDALSEEKLEPPSRVLRNARITMTSDMADVTIRPNKSDFTDILKQIVEISSQLDEPPDMFRRSNLIKFIADEKGYTSLIRSRLDKRNIAKELVGLTRLTLHLSPDEGSDSGLALFISELLYRHGINVIHSYIDEDAIIIINREDGPRAYEILQQEIIRSKEPVAQKTKRMRTS